MTDQRKSQSPDIRLLNQMAAVFAGLFNLAMRIERESLGAGHYERTPERHG